MSFGYSREFHLSSELEPVFDEVFGGRLLFCGFTRTASRKWVKEANSAFKYLFQLGAQRKGAWFVPCGAISLDFVPRLLGGNRFQIKPAARYAAVHLAFNPRPKAFESWKIEKHREGTRDNLERIAAESVTEITDWFQRFKNVDDVLVDLDAEKHRAGFGFYNFPQTVLAYTFVLARVGRSAEACEELDRIFSSELYDAKLRPELEKLLETETLRSKR